jgi:hypothetical protein
VTYFSHSCSAEVEFSDSETVAGGVFPQYAAAARSANAIKCQWRLSVYFAQVFLGQVGQNSRLLSLRLGAFALNEFSSDARVRSVLTQRRKDAKVAKAEAVWQSNGNHDPLITLPGFARRYPRAVIEFDKRERAEHYHEADRSIAESGLHRLRFH